jgi:putative membrane protein insertion efficiency factor
VRTIRRLLWMAGTPVRWALLALIRLYQLTLSGWLGGQCRFYPSCSQYAREAIKVHGAWRGSALATWRILRCGPFTAGGFDPVAPGRSDPLVYEDVIHEKHVSEMSRVDP